mmetsp:Transcript_29887/g.42014  ORF Transcript_29887/g.42014 Transcript_29887/m.42014 type:complete len:228 (-) Transcript_29887:89-772(-)
MSSNTPFLSTNENAEKKTPFKGFVIVQRIGVAAAVGVAVWSMRYWAGVRTVLQWQQMEHDDFVQPWHKYSWALITHLTGGIVALAVGPWQFFPDFRKRYPTYHRYAGYVYYSGIFLGGVGAFVLAPVSSTGFAGGSGLFSLAFLWWTTASTAFYRIWKQRDFRSHREWMIRNYALTFAAVTFRVQLLILQQFLPFMDAYRTVMWTCWVPNGIIVELYINYCRKNHIY